MSSAIATALEKDFISLLSLDSEEGLQRFRDRLQDLRAVVVLESRTVANNKSERSSAAQSVQRIALLADTFAKWQRDILAIEADARQATSSVLSSVNTACVAQPQSLDHKARAASSIRADAMRSWLLLHLEHPFPSTEEKQMMTERSKANDAERTQTLTAGQCTLWFINARRRSGWTRWSRRFCHGDRNRIRAIVAAIRGRSPPPNTSGADRPDEIETRLEELVVAKEDLDRHLSKHELAELCRREFQKVIDWIQQGPGQKVGDWMDEIAAEAKIISSKKRKCDVDDDEDEGKARKAVSHTRSARRQVAEKEGSSSSANIEEVEATEPAMSSRQMPTPRRDFSGPSTCSYSSFSSFVSGNTMAGSSTTSLTSFDEQPTHSSCPVTAFDDSPPLVSIGSSGEPSPSASYESPPALTPDAEAFVRRYLEEQRAQNAESMAASAPRTTRSHSPPPPERLIRKLPARGVAQAQYSEGNVFRPPVTAQAATGANWGLPATPASIRSTNTSRQASHSSDTPDYGGWLPFVGED